MVATSSVHQARIVGPTSEKDDNFVGNDPVGGECAGDLSINASGVYGFESFAGEPGTAHPAGIMRLPGMSACAGVPSRAHWARSDANWNPVASATPACTAGKQPCGQLRQHMADGIQPAGPVIPGLPPLEIAVAE